MRAIALLVLDLGLTTAVLLAVTRARGLIRRLWGGGSDDGGVGGPRWRRDRTPRPPRNGPHARGDRSTPHPRRPTRSRV